MPNNRTRKVPMYDCDVSGWWCQCQEALMEGPLPLHRDIPYWPSHRFLLYPSRFQPCQLTWQLKVEPFLSRCPLGATAGLLALKLSPGTTLSWPRTPMTHHLKPTYLHRLYCPERQASPDSRLPLWMQMFPQPTHRTVSSVRRSGTNMWAPRRKWRS